MTECRLARRTEKVNVLEIAGRNRGRAAKPASSNDKSSSKLQRAFKMGSALVRGDKDRGAGASSAAPLLQANPDEERYELCFEDDDEFARWWEILSTANRGRPVCCMLCMWGGCVIVFTKV